jgi:hypothetical protein
MSGLARANFIIVNTLDGNTDPSLCTLPDAIVSANTGSEVGGCVIGIATGADQIVFDVTGTIFVATARLPMTVSDPVLEILGPDVGGVTIDGGLNQETEAGIMFVSSLNKFLELENLTFADGLAEFGGAIFSNTSGDVDIKQCLFNNNTANFASGGLGGAIVEETGRMEVTNSTFFENDALKFTNTAGGAIFVEDTATQLRVTNSTFEHNYAKEGSAIFNNTASAANVEVKGTIFADNLDKKSSNPNCAGNNTPPVTDENYNISVDNSCGFTAGSSLNNVTAAQLDLDPLGLQNNGGPSFTVALESGSDAINRIPIAHCTQQDGDPIVTDQRLFGRPDPFNVNTCDSGAYEFDALGPYTLNNDRVQIASSTTTSNADTVNIGATFTANGDPDCDLGPLGDEDALNFGVGIALVPGTCASIPNTQTNGLFVALSPFVVHTVNHEQYGTFFASFGSEKVSARLLALPQPEGLCGEWTLNLEVSGLNNAGIGLGGAGPYALLISDLSDAESCFNLSNVIVGTQLPPPPTGHVVKRRVRRR